MHSRGAEFNSLICSCTALGIGHMFCCLQPVLTQPSVGPWVESVSGLEDTNEDAATSVLACLQWRATDRKEFQTISNSFTSSVSRLLPSSSTDARWEQHFLDNNQ
ncbi:hypothetical protein HID58_028319 [Brassica napus]|uniref:Uncharacterized protein n=1 Tax=Brassica napus TaxID=3708 RepID=A0ABQ8C9Z4_BRANA|nr:hypothetical protein HID58_028319 [Brassica napus]